MKALKKKERQPTPAADVLKAAPKKLHQYLLVRSRQAENAYGPFLAEILKSEGLNGFTVIDLDSSSFPDFQPDDLVVLSRCFLKNREMDLLLKAVSAGTRAVCIQPSFNLASRFGWAPQKRVCHPGWVRIRDGYPGSGTPIQTHLPVVLYKPRDSCKEVKVVADAVDAGWRETGHAAAVKQAFGSGKVALFFYDLPKAVARIRFGEPELASYFTEGLLWSCYPWPADLFMGHVDKRVLHVPQADLHGQLLAKVLTDISPYPLARLWYYEKPEHRAAAVFTSDDDYSTPEQFRELSASLLGHGGKATFYLMKDTHLSADDVRQLRDKGNTLAPHVDQLKAVDELYFDFPRIVAEQTRLFQERFGQCSVSLQCHGAPWQDYMLWVPLCVTNGYRMLMAYISYPFELAGRYMCGSARPLKFVGLDGTVHDCWQQPIVTYDDDSESAIARMKQDLPALNQEFKVLVDDSLERYHAPMAFLSHPINFSRFSKPFMEACLELLHARGVPIYNGDEWYAMWDRRSTVRIRQEVGAEGEVRVLVGNLEGRVTLMVPLKGHEPKVIVDGEKAEGVTCRRLEEDYVFVELEVGQRSGDTAVVVTW